MSNEKEPVEHWQQVLDDFLINDDDNSQGIHGHNANHLHLPDQTQPFYSDTNAMTTCQTQASHAPGFDIVNNDASFRTKHNNQSIHMSMQVPDPISTNRNSNNSNKTLPVASGTTTMTTVSTAKSPSSNAATTSSKADSSSGFGATTSTPVEEDEKAQLRSERKRHREKQRRSDVNSQFTNLMNLLKKIEADDLDSDLSDDEEEVGAGENNNGISNSNNNSSGNNNNNSGNSFGPPKKKKKRKVHIPAGTISNRIDLIARTIAIMDRLHQVNGSIRVQAREMKKSLKRLRHSYNMEKSDICDVTKPTEKQVDPVVNHGMMVNPFMNAMGGNAGMGSNNPLMNGMGMMMMVPGGMNAGNGQGGNSQQVRYLSMSLVSFTLILSLV